jgi:uridylate kinase
LDPLALKVIKRSKIRTILFDGRNPSKIFDVLGGKKIGTEISD